MPYPKKLLNPDEEVAVDLHPHWLYFAEALLALAGAIAVGIAVLAVWDPGETLGKIVKWLVIAGLVLAAGWTVERYLKWATTSFVITSDRIIFRQGMIAKRGVEIPLERVNNVNFNQSIFERIVGAGDLLIESGGESGQSRFTDIRRPEEVKNVIHSQMELNSKRQLSFAAPTGSDVASQLEKLEGLRDRGSITDEEFEAQKRRLLG